MSGRRAKVSLGIVHVGDIIEDDDGWIEFRLSQSYRESPRRPVLGQWFEDHPHANPRGDRPGALPAFFENLIPEGDLRQTLERSLDLAAGDHLGLLCAVGSDLPGAVVVDGYQGDAPPHAQPAPTPVIHEPGLRFSLAGVQLKFSMVRHGARFAIPGRDHGGEWIAKIAYDRYPGVCANEWVTMEWARKIGFDVPETELRKLSDLVDVPYDGDPDASVFVVRRYDRGDERRRIHQEDFQQIVGRKPQGKYDDITYDKLTLLALRIVGDDAFEEMIRRLAFVVSSGNDDAHMKNWSVVYPDGITAALSPLYDQVFTALWPQFSLTLALKLDGTKEFASVGLGHFRELARRIGRRPEEAERIAAETVERAAAAWAEIREHSAVATEYRAALQRHWRRVPLLQSNALLI